MSREDRLELVRMLAALHGMVALVVAAGGLLVTGGGVLVVAGCLVLVLAVVASSSGLVTVTVTAEAPGIIRGTTNAVAVTSAVPIEEITP